MSESFSDLNTVALKAKAIRGAGINISAHFVGFIFRTGGVIALSRLLTPEDFGVVAMVTAFSLLLMNFGVNGLTEFIIQKQEISKEEMNSLFWSHFAIAGVFSIGFVFLGQLLVEFYGEHALWGIAASMSFGFILYALFTCQFAILKRQMRFSVIALIELVAAILSVIVSLGLAVVGAGYWAVVARHLTVPLVMVGGAWLFSPWRPGVPRYLKKGLPGLKYAVQVYCNFTLSYFTKNIDKVLLGRFHGAAVLGSYDRGYYLSSLPADQLLTPLNSVALATLSRLKNDRERFLAYYEKAVSLIAFLGMLCSVMLMATARDLVLLLLGAAWNETGNVVFALAPGIGALLVYGTHSWLHLSLGTPNRWFRWNIVASSLTLIGFIIAVPYGAVAMGAAYSVRSLALMLPGIWYAGHPVRLDLRCVISSIWAYLISAILVYCVWLYISSEWLEFIKYFENFAVISRIAIAGGLGAGLYLGLVVVFERSFRSLTQTLSFIRVFLVGK